MARRYFNLGEMLEKIPALAVILSSKNKKRSVDPSVVPLAFRMAKDTEAATEPKPEFC